METMKYQWVSGTGGTRMSRWSTKDFQGRETILYDTIKVYIHYYTFFQTQRMYNTMSEL